MISDATTLAITIALAFVLAMLMGTGSALYLNYQRRRLRLVETAVHERPQEEMPTQRYMRDSEVIRTYRDRRTALREFASAIDAENTEMMIVGSSLKGLLSREEYREITEKLKFKISRGGVSVKFLLTHPVVADLRASQEARQFTEIGREIIESLLILKGWNVPPENVRLYKGPPTCFAIRTRREMLLNPYPYASGALDSPCLIVEKSEEEPSYFYNAFNKFHFGAWDTDAATRIFNFDETIRELQSKLYTYVEIVSELLQA